MNQTLCINCIFMHALLTLVTWKRRVEFLRVRKLGDDHGVPLVHLPDVVLHERPDKNNNGARHSFNSISCSYKLSVCKVA